MAQLLLGYLPILAAVWTPEGPYKLGLMLASTVLVLAFAGFGPYTGREMGIAVPKFKPATLIVGAGLLLAAAVPIAAKVSGEFTWMPHPLTWRAIWQYSIWATVQEFILQSFVFLRLESVLGSRRAVLVAAALFSLAHLPSPVLTLGTFLGGLFFCEMFRRYRNIFPIGLIHAVLGLTIAATFDNGILHHMRVGLGYLAYHS